MGCPCSKFQAQELHLLHQEEEEAGGNKNESFCNYTEALAQCKQRKELLRHAAIGEQQDHQNQKRDLRHSRSYALEYSPMAPQRVVVPPPDRSATFPSSSSGSRGQYFDGMLFKPPPPPPGCSSHYWDTDLLQKVQESGMPRCCSKEAIAGDDDEEDMVLELQGDEVKVTNQRRHESKAPEDVLRSQSANACAAAAVSESIEAFSSSACSSSSSPSSSDDQDQESRSLRSDLSIIPAVSELSPKELEDISSGIHQGVIEWISRAADA